MHRSDKRAIERVGACAMVVCMLTMGIVHAGKVRNGRTAMEIDHFGNGYVFDLRFSSPLPCDTLLRLLNDTSTVRELTSFVDSTYIRVLDSAAYEVHSAFGYLGYRGESVFCRRTFFDRDSIAISLLRFEHNWDVVPEVLGVEAFYTLDQGDSACEVRFFQKITLARDVGRLYMRLVRWQLRAFAGRLLDDVVAPVEEPW